MPAPTIRYAYLDHTRQNVIVVCRVDNTLMPLKVLAGGTATNGWTVRKAGIAQSIVGTVASPRPNCSSLGLDAALPIGDTLTVEYLAGLGGTGDQGNQELVTILTANAITVLNTLPIIDLIARDFAMRLTDITAANGFLFTLDVEDDLKLPQRLSESKAWVTYDDPQSEDDGPINHEQFTAAFSIHIATAQSTATDTPLTSRLFHLEAEVMKHVQVDYSRGNLAVDTIPRGGRAVTYGDEGGWGGIELSCLVRFRTLYGDRFSQ